MEFTDAQLHFLLSDRFEAVHAAYSQFHEKYRDSLRIQTHLRAAFPDLPPALFAAAAEQWDLRRRTAGKTALGPRALYTRTGAEQASSAAAASFHASLFAGREMLREWCAGVGSDTHAFAQVCGAVHAVEADAITAALLEHNMHTLGCTRVSINRARAEDDLATRPFAPHEALFADPSRRSDGTRLIDPERMSPPLSFCRAAATKIPAVIKIAPAAEIHDTFWKKCLLAVGDECKEQLLLRGFDIPDVSAADAVTGERWSPSHEAASVPGPTRPKYLIEPHAAVIRTGAVAEYFREYESVPVDPRIAYGISATLPRASRWHAAFEVLEVVPYQRRRVQEAIDAHDFGPHTEIKKRSFRLLPEQIRASFRFRGHSAGVLICTRIGDTHVVYLCSRVDGSGSTSK